MTIQNFLISIVGSSTFFLIFSCHFNAPQNKSESGHDGEVRSPAGSKIFVDRISNKQILKADLPDSGLTSFYSFKVGFEDSIAYNQKARTEWNVYFNYEMQKNWVLLLKGDSIFPVFFQPLIKRIEKLDEGIIVFEIEKGSKPDTMVYKNRFDNNTETFILKNK